MRKVVRKVPRPRSVGSAIGRARREEFQATTQLSKLLKVNFLSTFRSHDLTDCYST